MAITETKAQKNKQIIKETNKEKYMKMNFPSFFTTQHLAKDSRKTWRVIELMAP